MGTIQVEEFIQAIKEVVKGNDKYVREELIQELYCQLLRNHDKIFNLPTKQDSIYYARRLFKNRMYNFYKKEQRENQRFSELTGNQKELICSSKAEDLIEYNELKKKLIDFKTIDEKEKEYLKESISYSNGLKKYWDGVQDKNARFEGYKIIPPHTICQYIGMDSNHHKRFKNKLKKYLKTHGFFQGDK